MLLFTQWLLGRINTELSSERAVSNSDRDTGEKGKARDLGTDRKTESEDETEKDCVGGRESECG